MNIKDINTPTDIPKDIWKDIFDKQWALAEKYKDIEKMGDLLESLDTNIDTANGQKWIKDFAWRVTEELTEAQEALIMWEEKCAEADENGDGAVMAEANDYLQHYVEELIDALHFLTELTLIAGYKSDFVPMAPANCALIKWGEVVYQMGLMCNCLKNKPWKQTQMLTDRTKFEGYLKGAWVSLLTILGNRISEEQIYLYYFKKNEVNQFRIRSKY